MQLLTRLVDLLMMTLFWLNPAAHSPWSSICRDSLLDHAAQQARCAVESHLLDQAGRSGCTA